MQKLKVAIFFLLLLFTFFGCTNNDIESYKVTIKGDENQQTKAGNAFAPVILTDSDGSTLASISFTLFSQDDDGNIFINQNESLEFKLKVNEALSAENLKVYINNELINHLNYESFYHEYNYSYDKVEGPVELKIQGLSKDNIRKLEVHLPASTQDFNITYNDSIITNDNNIVEADYNSNLSFTVDFLEDVFFNGIMYQQDGSDLNGLESQYITNNTDRSMTVNFPEIKNNISEINVLYQNDSN